MYLFGFGGLKWTALQQVQPPYAFLRTGDGKLHIHRAFIFFLQHLHEGAHHPYELQIVHHTLAVRKVDGSVYMAFGQHVLGIRIPAQHHFLLPFGKEVQYFFQGLGAERLGSKIQDIHLALRKFVAFSQGGP